MKRRNVKKQGEQTDKHSAKEKAIILLQETKKNDKGKKMVRVDSKTVILIRKGENSQLRKKQFEERLSDSRNRISY